MAVDSRSAYRPGMEQLDSPAAADGGLHDEIEGQPAVRDAAAILARAACDEAAARAARDRYRTQPMRVLEPDERIAPLLARDEPVVAVRRGAVFDRRQPRRGSGVPAGIAGALYLTARRLVLVGRVTLSIDLGVIEEVGLSGGRVVLVLRDGTGVLVEVPEPRLLRVEIAAARASAKS